MPIIYPFQRTKWKTLLSKWAWIWKHGRIQIILLMNILERWIIKVPRQFKDADVRNKDTVDVIMDEDILECSWSNNPLAFRLIIELSNMSILCILFSFALANWICWTRSFRMSYYFYCSWACNTVHKFLKQFKRFVDLFGSWCIIASLTSIIIWHQ